MVQLRILIVSNLFPPAAVGGYERECAEVARSLAQRHEVRVLTSTRGRTKPAVESNVARALPFSGHGPRARLLAPLDAVRGARVMRRELAAFKPDLVWIWNGAQIPQSPLRVAETCGAAVAWRVCEHWFSGLYRDDPFVRRLLPGRSRRLGFWELLARALNRHRALQLDFAGRAGAAISWNSDALRRLSTVPPTARAVLERTIYPATSQAERLAGLERHAADATPLISLIGRVEHQKGPHVAVRALAELRERHGVDGRLALAGEVDRRMRRELERLAAQLGVGNRIEFRGQLELDGVAALLASSNAVVVPSVWQEPFGLVCVEAALAGVPVVAARSGGLVEILREPAEALFFPIGDAAACADALFATLHDDAATAARVERARRRAADFSLDAYLRETEAFVQDSFAALASAAVTDAETG